MDHPTYKVKVFKDFKNPKLQEYWIKIQEDNDVFPQMFYQWIKPWWRAKSGKRKLHIVTVIDEGNSIVAIAPFCIEKKLGLKILRNVPIHFGDFYSIISGKKKENEVIQVILDHVKTCSSWHVVHFFNVNNGNVLGKVLLDSASFKQNKIVDVHTCCFEDMNFQEYLQTLSKNTRSQYRKKVNRLSKKGKVTLEKVTKLEAYLEEMCEMKRLYNTRWKDNLTPLKSDEHYEMRNKAIAYSFKKSKAILYKLCLDGELIAYRIGFLHNKTFYDWRVSHDPDFNYYSPGLISVGKIIEDLIPKGFTHFNFMTGDYRFKRSWALEEATTTNMEFFYSPKISIGNLYVYYRVRYREDLRNYYYRLKQIKATMKSK